MANENYPHIQRPFTGLDLEMWRNRHRLRRPEAVEALGLTKFESVARNDEPLPYSLELLMRLYDEDSTPGVWSRDGITMPQLFEEMYAKPLAQFEDTDMLVEARVDLQSRFAKLLGRSKARAYRWLDPNSQELGGAREKVNSDLLKALSKLSQCRYPGSTLERLGTMIWKLRGENIDDSHPVPTLKNPPVRAVRGRPPGWRAADSKKSKDEIAQKLITTPIKIKEGVAKTVRLRKPKMIDKTAITPEKAFRKAAKSTEAKIAKKPGRKPKSA